MTVQCAWGKIGGMSKKIRSSRRVQVMHTAVINSERWSQEEKSENKHRAFDGQIISGVHVSRNDTDIER